MSLRACARPRKRPDATAQSNARRDLRWTDDGGGPALLARGKADMKAMRHGA
jgi:hypothetical protein